MENNEKDSAETNLPRENPYELPKKILLILLGVLSVCAYGLGVKQFYDQNSNPVLLMLVGFGFAFIILLCFDEWSWNLVEREKTTPKKKKKRKKAKKVKIQ